MAEFGEGRLRMRVDVVCEIKRMQAVDADQQNVPDPSRVQFVISA
jgi:hypothetical protein